MDKKCLLIQPGAFGDIILCAPIAKIYYDNGYEVHWPVTKKFISIIERFEYIKPILLDDRILHTDWLKSDVIKCLEYLNQNNFDIVLNLADRGPHPMANRPDETFEQCKYRLSNIPIQYKHFLSWTRNIDKENELYNKMVQHSDYVLIHRISSNGVIPPLPSNIKYPIVEINIIDGFDIFDWYKVIINAKEIYCVESSIQQFIDGIISDVKDIPKYLLSRQSGINFVRTTYSPYWKTY